MVMHNLETAYKMSSQVYVILKKEKVEDSEKHFWSSIDIRWRKKKNVHSVNIIFFFGEKGKNVTKWNCYVYNVT